MVAGVKLLVLLGLSATAVLADPRSSTNFQRRRRDHGPRRTGRQQQQSQYGNGGGNQQTAVPGGVDFSQCETQDDGMCCVVKETQVTSLEKEPLLECKHKEVEKCHYTYVTQFEPAQEEVCEENFEKKCQITFRQVATRETVQKCLTPLKKVCGEEQKQPAYGQPQYGSSSRGSQGSNSAPEECKTFYESSCTTRYIEKSPGKFVGDTSCEKQPIELCGQGCRMEQGEPECHDKAVDTLVDVPEEVCDLNPQKTCRFVTKLTPRLKPEHECTIIPQEVCNLKFSAPKSVDRPLMTKWCIDPNAEVEKDSTYEESEAAAAPISSYGAQESQPQYGSVPPPAAPAGNSYASAASAPQSYAQPAPAPQSYSEPAPQSYSQPAPAAPAPQSYAQPAAAPAPQSYSEPAPQSYSQPAPAAPAPQSYSEPAPQSYDEPAPQSYSQPAPAAPAPQSYSEPAPQSYGQPASATPSPVYYKPVAASNGYDGPSAPAQNPYSQPQPSYGGFRALL